MKGKDRAEAYALLCEHTQSDALRKHALAVEAVMRYYADQYGEDEAFWGNVGLLHDIDYEKYPDQHCLIAPKLLNEAGWDEQTIHAVVSHGWGICADIEPTARMEKVLYAFDELTGLGAIMRPFKSVLDLEVKSVKKKFKDKRFAAGVNREVVLKGCAMLEIELDEALGGVIAAMRLVAPEIGLQGEL